VGVRDGNEALMTTDTLVRTFVIEADHVERLVVTLFLAD